MTLEGLLNANLSPKDVSKISLGIGATLIPFITVMAQGHLLSVLKRPDLLSTEFYKTDIKNIFLNIASVTYSLFKYYFPGYGGITPACVIAGFPMPSLQEVSHASSDLILKYRATGGIFLAHQEGGEQTLRLVGKAFGLNRYIFLTVLDMLFLYGSARIYDLFINLFNNSNVQIGNLNSGNLAQVDPWLEVRKYPIDEGRVEKHLTFPVITKTRVYMNMYIETYDYVESVEEGMNCIKYSIFLRKYIPPYPYKFAEYETPSKTKLKYYAENKNDEIINTLRMLDIYLDYSYTSLMILSRFLNLMSLTRYQKAEEKQQSLKTKGIANTERKERLSENMALITSLNLNKQSGGDDHFDKMLSDTVSTITDSNDLVNLTIEEKEELVVID
ncbi:MAG: hypothetical protein ACTSQY_00115 [Candidatus Odinarchaeia archaeon]